MVEEEKNQGDQIQEESAGKENGTETDEQAVEQDWERLYGEIYFQLEQEKENTLRILAESENLKKRLIREKEQHCRFATSALVEELLPIVDTLEMAITHGATNEACASLVQGVEMTLKMFFEVLKKQDVEPVGTVGEFFDPNLHEAMGQTKQADLEDGCVGSLLQRGYRQKERLLRPAKVLVNKKDE